ncbi:MAG: hypothetical protein M3R45_11770 [Pseudomonadota bacterium]|nr:hypothetical protein [Pseudomonadota bacterium]
MSPHNAPPVAYPLGRSYFLGGLLLGLWCAGLLLLLQWYRLTLELNWRLLAGLAGVLAAGLAAASNWKNAPNGQLVWDGEVWHWQDMREPAGLAAQEMSVIADFQRCLLLKLKDQCGASLWLWVEQRAMPARWLDLRRAVYSPRKSSNAAHAHDVLTAQPVLSRTSSASANFTASAVAVSTARPSIAAAPPQP